MLAKCHQATASDLPFYDIFAPQKVTFSKISDDVIACDLWFGPPQSKILATPMTGNSLFEWISHLALTLKVRLDWTRSNAKQREAKVGDLRQPSRVVAYVTREGCQPSRVVVNLRDRSLHRLILIKVRLDWTRSNQNLTSSTARERLRPLATFASSCATALACRL